MRIFISLLQLDPKYFHSSIVSELPKIHLNLFPSAVNSGFPKYESSP